MVRFRSLKLKPTAWMILVNNTVTIIIGAIFHFLLPLVLNYPPYSINNEFQLRVSGIYYTWQYILIVLIILAFTDIFILVRLRKLDRLKEYLEKTTRSRSKRSVFDATYSLTSCTGF